MREHEIGRHQAQSAHHGGTADPGDRQAGQEPLRQPHRRDHAGLPDVGLCQQKTDDQGEDQRADGRAGNFLVGGSRRQQPCGHDREGRFQEFGWLDRESEEINPAAGALDVLTAGDGQYHQHQGHNEKR
jgi:hypothetical protein